MNGQSNQIKLDKLEDALAAPCDICVISVTCDHLTAGISRPKWAKWVFDSFELAYL